MENKSQKNSLVIILSMALICATAVIITMIVVFFGNNDYSLQKQPSVGATITEPVTQPVTEATTQTTTVGNVSPTVVVVVPDGHNIKPQYDYVRIGEYYRISYDTPGDAGLNVRSEPTYYSSKIVTLPEGTRVRLIDDYRNGENGYVHISFDTISGVTDGWILSAYLV